MSITDALFGEKHEGNVAIPKQVLHDLRLLIHTLENGGDIDNFHPGQINWWKSELDLALSEKEEEG